VAQVDDRDLRGGVNLNGCWSLSFQRSAVQCPPEAVRCPRDVFGAVEEVRADANSPPGDGRPHPVLLQPASQGVDVGPTGSAAHSRAGVQSTAGTFSVVGAALVFQVGEAGGEDGVNLGGQGDGGDDLVRR
jgi:hypothetical protein